MSKLFKRTKILATVGPSVFGEEKLKELVYAGVNGFRLNFSHGSYDERDEQIRIIRKYAAERGKSVAILQDLQGPKIRLGDIKDNHLDLKKGDEIILDYALKEHDGGMTLPVQYNLAKRAKALNLDAIHDTVHEMARDEARHGKALKGLLERYFK